jgi:hypothetical protein
MLIAMFWSSSSPVKAWLGELAALVGVENLRLDVPGQNPPTEPIHHRR